MYNWNTKDLFSDNKALDSFIASLEVTVLSFEKKYKKRLGKLNCDEFYEAITLYEQILEKISKCVCYTFLEFAVDSTRGAFFARYQRLTNNLQEKILFFEIEFNQLKDKKQNDFINHSKKYSYFLENLQKDKKHQLSLKEELVLLKKEPVSVSSFSRLFDEHLSRLKFNFNNKKLSEEEILSLLYDTNRDTRKKAQESLTKGLEPHLHLLGYILNMVKTDTEINMELRKYKTPEQIRHMDNQITQKSVDSLIESVLKNTSIVHSYYKIKGKILGLKELYDYDRYAPIGKSEKEYNFEYSKDLVLSSLDSFSPIFGNIARKAFDDNWIDVMPRYNKRGGAFSHQATTDTHPYILLNHTNKRRDLFTLAHEIGHSIHQYLSYSVGFLNCDTPLTTSETASVFAEMLLFDSLKKQLSGEELIELYAGKIEDIFATLFRQIIFTTFERRIHSFEGELSVDKINSIWIEENDKMFGESIKLSKNYSIWWSYIPHFIHSPFYCYAYSYGQLLVLALFGLYKSGFENFENKYIEFLSSGGSKSPKDLVLLFGFDIEDISFWDIGIQEVKKIVDEFENLIKG